MNSVSSWNLAHYLFDLRSLVPLNTVQVKLKKHNFRLQNTRHVCFPRKKTNAARLHYTESQTGDAATNCFYQNPNILISRFWPLFACLRIWHGGGFLAKCTEAINETMPYIYIYMARGLIMYLGETSALDDRTNCYSTTFMHYWMGFISYIAI